jgi:exonuclease III
MAYRKKASMILAYKPDIVIIPECEHPDKLKFEPGIPSPDNLFWFGSNPNKGLGIFSYGNYKFQLNSTHNQHLRTIVPLTVSKDKLQFTLFAIWANNPNDRAFQYIGQVWKAINFYSDLLTNKKTILAGDFNSNTIWDKPKREGNHTKVVEILASKEIYSTYHEFFRQKQGKEKHSTLFMYRHKDKPYHIDYCFASKDFIQRLSKVEIGKHKDWCKQSDHTPLIVTFND